MRWMCEISAFTFSPPVRLPLIVFEESKKDRVKGTCHLLSTKMDPTWWFALRFMVTRAPSTRIIKLDLNAASNHYFVLVVWCLIWHWEFVRCVIICIFEREWSQHHFYYSMAWTVGVFYFSTLFSVRKQWITPSNSLFITNTTISFKMKYPNLADVLDTAAPGIDHSKILSYGCQCQFLDGRPLAASGNGHPVDPIDAACKQYRECQTCAQMDDGADCNVENVDWMYRIDLDVPLLDCLDPGLIRFRPELRYLLS